MEMTKGNLKDAEMVINKLMTTAIPVKVAYRLEKILGKVNNPLMDIEKSRIELVDKYGEKDEKKGGKQVPPEKMKEFTDAFIAILEEKVEVDIQLIPFELIVETNIPLSARDMAAIKPFMAEPVEDKKVK